MGGAVRRPRAEPSTGTSPLSRGHRHLLLVVEITFPLGWILLRQPGGSRAAALITLSGGPIDRISGPLPSLWLTADRYHKGTEGEIILCSAKARHRVSHLHILQ